MRERRLQREPGRSPLTSTGTPVSEIGRTSMPRPGWTPAFRSSAIRPVSTWTCSPIRRTSARPPPWRANSSSRQRPASGNGTGGAAPSSPGVQDSSFRPGIGFPYGDVAESSSSSTSLRSTASLITCSQRQARDRSRHTSTDGGFGLERPTDLPHVGKAALPHGRLSRTVPDVNEATPHLAGPAPAAVDVPPHCRRFDRSRMAHPARSRGSAAAR